MTQREMSSMGGKAAHASGNAHEFTQEEAVIAGRKGGQAPHHRCPSCGAVMPKKLPVCRNPRCSTTRLVK